MKKTDLEKNKALKLMGQLKASATPARFAGTMPAIDRREQRRQDQAAGLVSFPLKLQQPVIDALRAKSAADHIEMNDLVNVLLLNALKP